MYLKSVKIKHFRSIEQSELVNCGDLNVLIGKNNSGKSNIFSGINTFFDCIKRGPFITLNPNVGSEIDFFNRQTNLPIEIALNFILSLSERDSLLGDIVTEAPQMKNAVEGIDVSLYLIVTVVIPNTHYAYIKEIIIVGEHSNIKRTILNISDNAAQELYYQLTRSIRENRDIEMLTAFANYVEESEQRRSVVGGERQAPSSLMRRFQGRLSNILTQKVDQFSALSSSTSDFLVKIREYITLLKQETPQNNSEVHEKLITNKVGTFSGDEAIIPHYVQALLDKVAAKRLLYLTEQRKQIGKEEAEELLSLKVEKGGDEIFKDFQGIVTSLLGVKIDAYRNRGTTNAKLDIDDFLVEVNGSGIREALRMVLDVKFREPDLLLVEEPEIHLQTPSRVLCTGK